MVRPINLEKTKLTGIRGHVAEFVENKNFTNFIIVLILINAVTLGIQTDEIAVKNHGKLLHFIDFVILGIFVLEILLKFIAYGFSFFRAGWNLFDFIIIGISLIPTSNAFSILRTLRVLRVLRLLSVIPSMRRVISALLHSIPGMTSIIGVLLIIFYVSAVLTTQMFGHSDDPQINTLFGSFPHSMYTLFQVMTLEGWSENVVEPTMTLFPWAWIFFIPFIIVTSFAVLNLFIGIIVDAMHIIHGEDYNDGVTNNTTQLKKEIQKLRKDIAELKETLKTKN
jgi:voltage-gated sodium channel